MHVLVAVDRSEESHNALVSALDIVDTFTGTVTVVHAVAPDGLATGTNTPVPVEGEADTDPRGRGETVLREAVERADTREISVDTEVLVGDPIEVIADYAEDNDVDVIYLGHRGLSSEDDELSGERRGPLGSVAKGVIERTQVPVTVFDRGL